MITLAFDLGIKNLAYCLLKQKDPDNISENHTIIDWNNINLLEGGISSQSSNRCKGCSGPGHFKGEGAVWCKGCSTGIRRPKKAICKPTLGILPGCTNKKLPKLLDLRKLAGADYKKSSREDVEKHLASLYLMPYVPPKAKAPAMYEIFKNMSAWLDTKLSDFKQADVIKVENQPCMTNPVIKSVQMILFTLLWEKLTKTYDWKGLIQFVHAKVKTEKLVEGETKDDHTDNVISHVKPESIDEDEEAMLLEDSCKKGKDCSKTVTKSDKYNERKKAAEDETEKILKIVNESEKWIKFFKDQTKKSDLADCLLMAVAPVLRNTNS
jgi:hypothetical protein